MKKIIATVIMTVYNDASYIEKAIRGVLAQSFRDFEFIIIDDHSTDSSPRIIERFEDKRIRFFRNRTNLGISKSRNRAISLAKGEFIFFTDSDCVADKNWVIEGIRTLKRTRALGVEGYTCYVSPGYRTTIADKLPGTVEVSGQYMGCNLAYRKSVLLKLGGFDEGYEYHEDREFALRAKRSGRIAYCRDMIVIHQKKKWTFSSIIESAKRVHDRILLFENHEERQEMIGRILYPKNLVKILLPPLVFIVPLLKGRCRSWNDFLLLIAEYAKLVYQRYVIWRTAFCEGIFVI